jgi:hypothetical protein
VPGAHALHRPSRSAPTRWAARRGVTLIETVLGAMLLGMVAATLAGTVGAIQRQAARDKQRLAAIEIANRLVLQQVDDDENLPSQSLPIAYDGMMFRWNLSVRSAGMTLSDSGRNFESQQTGGGFDIRRRLRVATVNVWLAEESGGSATDTSAVPRASVSRLFDPIAFRNADSTERKYGDDIERMVNELFQMTAGAPAADEVQGSGSGSGPGSGGDQQNRGTRP